MKFQSTEIAGCFVIDPEPRGDHRGFFSRIFDADLFKEHGLAPSFVQFNNSLSRETGTLRGLHYQRLPAGEDKLVRCISGKIFDVVVDLRAGSKSYRQWVGFELSSEDRRLVYAPKGCAHGFLTLSAETELVYFASAPYSGGEEMIVRWNDPAFAIDWPIVPRVLSDKDRDAPDFDPVLHDSGYVQ